MEWCATKRCGKIMVWQCTSKGRPSLLKTWTGRYFSMKTTKNQVTTTRQQQVVLPKVALNHPIRYDLGRSNRWLSIYEIGGSVNTSAGVCLLK